MPFLLLLLHVLDAALYLGVFDEDMDEDVAVLEGRKSHTST
jgi:hypothetical protein